MANTDLTIKFTYEQIRSHLLVHLQGPKINHWMLLDLEELAQKTGKSVEEVFISLTRSSKDGNNL